MGMRKRLTGLAALVFAAISATGAVAQTAALAPLGANFNAQVQELDFTELQRADAKWVHLVVHTPQLDTMAQPANQPAIRTALEAVKRGYRVAVSLRFPFTEYGFPAPDTPQMANEFARLDKSLGELMGKADMVMIGSEPFIETRVDLRNLGLNAFYETLAKRAIAHRTANCAAPCKTALYMGALNRLDIKANQTPSTERWMAFVKDTPELSGTAFNMHLPSLAASKAFTDYVVPRLRPDQKFVVPQFSLIWDGVANLKTAVPPNFAAKYGAARNVQHWQLQKAALETPFSKPQWDELLSETKWIEANKHYIRDQMALLRGTGRLALATYQFKQGKIDPASINNTRPPWLLYTIYADRSVKRTLDGSATFNYAWIDDFRAAQKE